MKQETYMKGAQYMDENLFRDEYFTMENFNKGHYIEVMDRLHMVEEHLHSAFWNHEGLSDEESIMITQASDLLMKAYQSVGRRIDD